MLRFDNDLVVWETGRGNIGRCVDLCGCFLFFWLI